MKRLWKAYDISIISVVISFAFFSCVMLYDRNIGVIGLAVILALTASKIGYHNRKKAKF